MKTRTIVSLGMASFALSVSAIGGVSTLAIAGDQNQTADAKKAVKAAAAARKALAKHEAPLAIMRAEAAVGFDPQNGEYRALLGEAYLFAGRFISAGQALTDALSLDPSNGRAALNLVLAQIATGDWGAARTTLEAHGDKIGTADRGLALALAGDPAGGVAILMTAAQGPQSDAKTRQNLALALALSGEWQKAKMVASADLSPAIVDQRIMQWASFARPANSYDQVASLLGVQAVADAGQPVQLALNPSSTTQLAVAKADAVDAYMPAAAPTQATQAPVELASVEAEPIQIAAAAEEAPAPAFETPTTSGVVFATRQEVVQAMPDRIVKTASPRLFAKAAPVKIAAKSAPTKGNYFVQLGAFDSAGVARDAWGRATRRVPRLSSFTPAGMQVNANGRAFYRLSVGGFSRGDAAALCSQVKASGGACFVRVSAGDQLASWAKSGTRMAAR